MANSEVEIEWPDVIGETEFREEYGRISEAVGELTAATLDAKIKRILAPDIVRSLKAFLTGVQNSLDESLLES
jgi:hypothetical protein